MLCILLCATSQKWHLTCLPKSTSYNNAILYIKRSKQEQKIEMENDVWKIHEKLVAIFCCISILALCKTHFSRNCFLWWVWKIGSKRYMNTEFLAWVFISLTHICHCLFEYIIYVYYLKHFVCFHCLESIGYILSTPLEIYGKHNLKIILFRQIFYINNYRSYNTTILN